MRHYSLTGVYNAPILRNVRWLFEHDAAVKIRIPLINGLNTAEEEIIAFARFLAPYAARPNFLGVDLLPYHKYGVHKYTQLNIEYPIKHDASLSDEELSYIERIFAQYNVSATIMRH